MAHKVLGIDLGAYSVKVVVATAGFRQSTVTDYLEAPIPPGDEPVEERAARAVGELIRARGLEHDLPYVSLPGEALSMRVLEFGFSGLKRADLEKAVGAELEAQLPHELDEIVYDFDVVPRDAEVVRSAAEDADPQFVAGKKAAPPKKAPPLGTRVLCAAIPRVRVARFLAVAGQEGLEPRGLLAAPAAYVRAASRLAGLGGAEAAGDAVMVIDHGHARTNVCVVKHGRAIFARTLSRGGRHVTLAICRAWNLGFEDAERAKHSDGFVASQREPAQSDAWARISDVVKQELLPLVRDLRQTAAACRAQTGVSPKRAVLCGGGGRLRGLASFLSEELGLPMGQVTADDAPRVVGEAAAARGVAPDAAVLALGVALEGASGRALFDLRRGEFAYRADFSFLRAKAGYLATAALVMVAFGAADAYAALYKLRKEEQILDERLRTATTEVFGAPATAAEVQEKLSPVTQDSPLPKASAFDLLVEISKKLPPRDKLKLDVSEIEIKKDKITLKATTDSVASKKEIEQKLKEISCFTEVTAPKSQGSAEEQQFTLTITSKCM